MNKPTSPNFTRVWLHAAIILLSGAILPRAGAQTSTVVQSKPFSFSINGVESGSGSFNNHDIAPLGSLSATFAPFDPELGTLISFTLEWDLTVTGSVDPANGMGIDTTGSGNLELGGKAYDGTGGGSGGGSSASFTVNPSTTFLVAEAGTSYDPAIYDTVTGRRAIALISIAAR